MSIIRDRFMIFCVLLVLLVSPVFASMGGSYIYGIVNSEEGMPVDNALVYVYTTVYGNEECICASQLASNSGKDGSYVEAFDNLVLIKECSESIKIGEDCSSNIDPLTDYIWIAIEGKLSIVDIINKIEEKNIISNVEKTSLGYIFNSVVEIKYQEIKSSSSTSSSRTSSSSENIVDNSSINDVVPLEPIIAEDIAENIVDEKYSDMIKEGKGKSELILQIEQIIETPKEVEGNNYYLFFVVLILLLICLLYYFINK